MSISISYRIYVKNFMDWSSVIWMLLSTKPLRGNPYKNETKKPFKINKSEKKGTYFLEVRFDIGLELTLGIYYPVSYRR